MLGWLLDIFDCIFLLLISPVVSGYFLAFRIGILRRIGDMGVPLGYLLAEWNGRWS